MSAPATTTTALPFTGVLALIDVPSRDGKTLAPQAGPLVDHPDGTPLGVALLSYATIDGNGNVVDGPQRVGAVDEFAIAGGELRIAGTAHGDTPDGAKLIARLEAGDEVRVGFSIAPEYEVDETAPEDQMRFTSWRVTHVVAEVGLHADAVPSWDGMVIRAAQGTPAAAGE